MFTITTIDDDTYTIDPGPPMLLSDGTTDWLIVTRPMPEAFSATSRGWYDAHPSLPERSRRLQAWLEDRLIDWLPLASTAAHRALRETLCDVALGRNIQSSAKSRKLIAGMLEGGMRLQSTPGALRPQRRKLICGELYSPRPLAASGMLEGAVRLQSTPGSLRPQRKKLILRRAARGKRQLSHMTHTITFDAEKNDYYLKSLQENMEATFSSAVIPLASKNPALAQVDPRVIGFWDWVTKNKVKLETPAVFIVDDVNSTPPLYCLQYGKITIDMELVKTTQDLVDKFKYRTGITTAPPAVEKETANASESPAEVAELLDDYTAPVTTSKRRSKRRPKTRPSKPQFEVHPDRVGGVSLPALAWIQYGEIFNSKISWDTPCEAVLTWSKECNLDNEVGINTDGGGWGYAGYEPTQSLYLRYNAALPGQEHCMRILQMPGVPVLRPVKVDEDAGEKKGNADEKSGEGAEESGGKVDESKEDGEEEGEESSEEASEEEGEEGSEESGEEGSEKDGEESGEEAEADVEALLASTNETTILGDKVLMDALKASVLNKDTVVEWLEERLKSDPADMVGFITEVYETYTGQATPEPTPTLAPVQYLLQVWTRENCEKDEPPVNMIASSRKVLAKQFRQYATKNRKEEDYMSDEEFKEIVDELCEDIAGGKPDKTPELNIAYALDLYTVPSGQSAKSKKLKSAEAGKQKDSSKHTMAKTKKQAAAIVKDDDSTTDATISVKEVATLFCDLGIGLAAHFNLDTSEVVEYLDGVCEDVIGVNPDAAGVFSKVKKMNKSASASVSASTSESASDKPFEVYMEAPGAKKKNKFWKCTVEDCEMTTVYGSVGDKGASSTKSFDSNEKAITAAKKLVQQKIKAGYAEPTDSEQGSGDDDGDNSEQGSGDDDSDNSEQGSGDDDSDNSEQGSDTEPECPFVYTKGPQKGKKCRTKPKTGVTFCGKHKDCKVAKKVKPAKNTKAKSASSDSDEKSTKKQKNAKSKSASSDSADAKPVKKNTKAKPASSDSDDAKPVKKQVKKNTKAKSASSDSDDVKPAKKQVKKTSKCKYVGKNGECEIKPKGEETFCAKHANTQQAINYKANESPVAKKTGKKLSQESKTKKKGPNIVRNKEAKVWIVEGQNLLVKSPKNPTVYGYLTKKGTKNETLTKAVKILAEELGLKTAAT